MQENKWTWVRCPVCGHKLFRTNSDVDLEIKCSSCKGIVRIVGGVTVGYSGDNKKRTNND